MSADLTRRPGDLSDLYAALDSAHSVMALSSQDWSVAGDFAWLYGILVGWDNDPTGGDVDQQGSALDELAARFGWDDDKVYRLRMLRLAVERFDLDAVADLADADGLRRKLKQAHYMERMAERHAIKTEADEARAHATIVNRDAEIARLNAEAARLRLELHDARAQVRRVRDLCDRALADPGDSNGGDWEDPTPIPGWTTAVLNALGDEEEQQ